MRAGFGTIRGRLAISVVAVGISLAGLSACSNTADAQNAVVAEQLPVAATSPDVTPVPDGPDSLAIAQQRLDALTAEQRSATTERTNVESLIASLKASSSCKRETKSCEKKLSMLVGELARLDLRIEQLPRAITATSARVAQLQAQSP